MGIDEDDYVYVTYEGKIGIPHDVVEAYRKIDKEEFHIKRKQIVWLIDCMDMVAKLYAVAPIDILVKMYRKRKNYKLSKEEILKLYDNVSEDDSLCIIYDNRVMDYMVYEHNIYHDIERTQGDKPNELSARIIGKKGKRPTIVPGSSRMAEMLMQERNEIEDMGFKLDFDSNSIEIPVTSVSSDRNTIQTKIKKVYPNDPCPCGSGKKFKQCCGRSGI